MNLRPAKKPLLEEEDEIPTSTSVTNVRWYDKRLEKNPQDIGLRFGKARLLMKEEKWERAKEELNEITRLDPDQVQAWEYLSVVNRMIGDAEGLLRCYEKLERLRSWNESTLCEHGRALLSMGRFEEAKERFEDVLEMDETYAEAWAGRSEAIRQLETTCFPHEQTKELAEEKEKEIMEGYERALDKDPMNRQALQGRAEISLYKKNGKEALEFTETGLRRIPD